MTGAAITENMFFILGARDRTIEVAAGYFFCPACGRLRRYTRRRLARYFTLYFLPIFQLEALGEMIQCQACQGTYRVEDLERAARLVTDAELLKAVKAELQRGLPIHRLQRRLLDDGMDRGDVARIVDQASHGQQRTCPHCQFSYLASVRYCTNCGCALSAPKPPPQLEEPH